MALNQALLDEVQEVLGGQAFLVGGAVRDHVMGREVDDFDFCTPLSPDEVVEKVRAAGKRVFKPGLRFGTVGFKSGGEKVEVTTFRHEVFTPGSRKPSVEFVQDLNSDLARRDFTFNAMALDANGKLHDPFGGQEDVGNGLVRGVGNVADRFTDDPLRMVRAVRFVSQLGFDLHPDTFEAMEDQAPSLHNVARERWVQEFDKLLLGASVSKALFTAHEARLLLFMFPEFNGSPARNVGKGTLDERWRNLFGTCVDRSLFRSHAEADAVRRVVAEGMALRLKFSNERRAVVTS